MKNFKLLVLAFAFLASFTSCLSDDINDPIVDVTPENNISSMEVMEAIAADVENSVNIFTDYGVSVMPVQERQQSKNLHYIVVERTSQKEAWQPGAHAIVNITSYRGVIPASNGDITVNISFTDAFSSSGDFNYAIAEKNGTTMVIQNSAITTVNGLEFHLQFFVDNGWDNCSSISFDANEIMADDALAIDNWMLGLDRCEGNFTAWSNDNGNSGVWSSEVHIGTSRPALVAAQATAGPNVASIIQNQLNVLDARAQQIEDTAGTPFNPIFGAESKAWYFALTTQPAPMGRPSGEASNQDGLFRIDGKTGEVAKAPIQMLN